VAPEVLSICGSAARAVNVGFWVRASELSGGLEHHLLECLREWLATEWGFDCIVFAISEQETRQAKLLAEAGLRSGKRFMLPDGRWRLAYR
jgi:hypothetical protein